MLNVFLWLTGMCHLLSIASPEEMTYHNISLRKKPRSNRYYKPFIYRRLVPGYTSPFAQNPQYQEPNSNYWRWMHCNLRNKIQPVMNGYPFVPQEVLQGPRQINSGLPLFKFGHSVGQTGYSPLFQPSKVHNYNIPEKNLRSIENTMDRRKSNGSYIQIPENETMIISPTILIGTKKQSKKDQTEWILSNKPLNLYIGSANTTSKPVIHDYKKKRVKENIMDKFAIDNATISKVVIYSDKNKFPHLGGKSEEEPVTEFSFHCKIPHDVLNQYIESELSNNTECVHSENRSIPAFIHRLDKKWLQRKLREKIVSPWKFTRMDRSFRGGEFQKKIPRGVFLKVRRKKKLLGTSTSENSHSTIITSERCVTNVLKKHKKKNKNSTAMVKNSKRSISKIPTKLIENKPIDDTYNDYFYYYLDDYPAVNNRSIDYLDYIDDNRDDHNHFSNFISNRKPCCFNKEKDKENRFYEYISVEPIETEDETEKYVYVTNTEDENTMAHTESNIVAHPKMMTTTTPFTPLLIPPEKAECERKYKAKCICSMKGFIKDINNKLSEDPDEMTLLKSIITYSCQNYIPIVEEYNITSDLKPWFTLKKSKELLQGPETGPKEITPDIFEQFLMRGLPADNDEFFVFPSTTVEVPCFTTNDMKLSPNLADSTKYQWTHSNEKAITEGRISEDIDRSGTLRIQDVTLEDSDNYTCTVSYIDPDTEDYVNKRFVHVISVVVLPRLVLHTNLHYTANTKCNQEVLEMFEIYLPQYLNNIVCNNQDDKPVCSIEIHNPLCHSLTDQDSIRRSIDPRLLWRADFKKTRWIRDILKTDTPSMEMSMNFELDLKPLASFIKEVSNRSLCNPHCQQKLLLKEIEILRDSFLEALMTPVKSQAGIVFQPSIDSLDIKLLIACGGGLELRNGFCMPCPQNYYSEEGNSECLPCPGGYYQNKIASKSCVKCPHPFAAPGCLYMGSIENITILSVALLVLTAFIGLSINLIVRIAGRSSRKKEKLVQEVNEKFKRDTTALITEELTTLFKKKPEPLPTDFE